MQEIDFKSESCVENYLEIMMGDKDAGKVVKKFCSGDSSGSVSTNSNGVYVKWVKKGDTAALLFLTHKNTGINKILYCQNLSSRLSNFYKAPELDMKHPQLSSGVREKCIRPKLLGSRLF